MEERKIIIVVLTLKKEKITEREKGRHAKREYHSDSDLIERKIKRGKLIY